MKTASINSSIDPQKETLVTRAGPVWPSNEQYLLEQSTPFPDASNHNGLRVRPDVIRSAASNISRTENIIRTEKIMNVKRKCEESSENIGLTDKRQAKKKPSAAGKDVHYSSKSDLIILKNNAVSRSEAASNGTVENNKDNLTHKQQYNQMSIDVFPPSPSTEYGAGGHDFDYQKNFTAHCQSQCLNERPSKKRKQSIRESAKKSKLCLEQEFENFQADADRLSMETAVLTNELRRNSEECANLIEENDSLMDEMEEACGHDAISDLKAMKPGGCSKDRSLQRSSDSR